MLPQIPTNATPQEILKAGAEAANGKVSLACSFSVEDVVIIDMAHSLGLPIGVFALDTGRLNEETYEVADAIVERYRVKIDWYFPKHDEVEQLEREKGLFSFRESLENRHECCHIRKVEPLGRALKGLAGWITGLRREQSVTRIDLAPVELDKPNGGILKINPLLEWSEAQVWDYAEARRVPTNRLHKQGYPSIGCAPCTRPVAPGEHPRAGRWWWENPEHKECGLHKR
jgi:phosphoadenosine phosphosulfate reductase